MIFCISNILIVFLILIFVMFVVKIRFMMRSDLRRVLKKIRMKLVVVLLALFSTGKTKTTSHLKNLNTAFLLMRYKCFKETKVTLNSYNVV